MKTISEMLNDIEWIKANREAFVAAFALQMSKKLTNGEAWIARKGNKLTIRKATNQGFIEPYAPFQASNIVEAMFRGGRALSEVLNQAEQLRVDACMRRAA